jgi:hypothetical protein
MPKERDRLLGPPLTSNSEEPRVKEGSKSSNGRLLFVSLGVLVVGLVAFFGGRLSLGEKEIEPTKIAAPRKSEAEAGTPPAAGIAAKNVAPEPKVLALDNSLRFRVPRECTADGTLEKIYLKLDKAMEEPLLGQTVKLDELAGSLAVEVESKIDADGARVASSYVRFPSQSRWNSLRLSRARVNLYAPPESDSAYTRSLTFQNTPVEVRNALNRLGFAVPLAPSYSELHDEACGGAMQIEAISGGASLSCGWGC